MDDYLLAVGLRTGHSTGDHSMDDHKDTLHAGLQPGLEPAAEAFDAVDLAVVGRIMKGLVWSGRWSEFRLFGRIGSEEVVEFGWLHTEILAQLQTHQKHYLLSAESGQYLEHSAAIADHSSRRYYSDKHFADCQTCSKRTCRSRQTSNHPAEAGPAVEAVVGSGKQKDSCQTAETAEFADRKAHMPSAQALISLAEVLADRSGCMDIERPVMERLCHLVEPDLAAVW